MRRALLTQYIQLSIPILVKLYTKQIDEKGYKNRYIKDVLK